MKFILFTKSTWNETARLRHQVARLLVKRSHEVLFFEKNTRRPSRRVAEAEGIQLRQHGELVYHQLRVISPLSALNASYEKREIKELSAGWSDATIINFSYDYYFLRDLFPDNPIITFINDDFIAAAKRIVRPEARRVLAATVRMSDHTFVLSYPLLDQVRQFTPNVSLFLHWARQTYTPPRQGTRRDQMIYWGYINDRIDLRAVLGVLDAGIKVNFVGPINEPKKVQAVLQHANAAYHGEAELEEIPEVVDACACSILPYDIDPATYHRAGTIAAITINNRAFQILSFGLPLLYSDLPGLIDAPGDVIYKCKTAQDYIDAFEQARDRFEECQPSIQRFLQGHTEQDRYEQLMRPILDALRHRGASQAAEELPELSPTR